MNWKMSDLSGEGWSFDSKENRVVFTGDTQNVFAVKLKEGVKNFPSDMDVIYYRKVNNVPQDVPVAVFNTEGKWVDSF